MRILSGHTKDVRGAVFLPDGRLMSVGSDKTARLWDVQTGDGKVIHKARGPLYALAASPEGRVVAVAGRNGTPTNTVVLCDLATGMVMSGVSWEVEDAVFRVTWGQITQTREPVARSIWSLSFSADGKYLAAAGRKPGGGNIPNGGGWCCWPTATWFPEGEFRETDAYAVRFASTGDTLAVTVRGGVRFYLDFGKGSEPVTVPVQCDWAPAVEFIPGRDTAVIAAGGHVYVAAFKAPNKPSKLKTGMRVVTALAPTPDGRSLLVGGKPGQVEVYDLTASVPVRKAAYDFDIGGVFGLSVARDGMTFAVAGEQGLLVCDLDG